MPYKNQEDQKACAKAHYQANKAIYKERAIIANKANRKIVRAYVADYLSTHPCVDCGESDPIVLEFDHLRDKFAGVAVLKNGAYSLKMVQDEIAKCEVRCANCHRRITHKRRGGEVGIILGS